MQSDGCLRSICHHTIAHRTLPIPFQTTILVVLALLCGGPILFYALPRLIHPRPRWHRAGQKADVVIVLGCRVPDHGKPGPRLTSRVRRGVELIREGTALRMITTGGAVYSPHIEAESMAKLAVEMGLTRELIFTEPEARNTVGNAVHSAALMKAHGWSTAIVVTDGSHCFRANLLFLNRGISHTVAAAVLPPDVPVRTRFLHPIWESWILWKFLFNMLPPESSPARTQAGS